MRLEFSRKTRLSRLAFSGGKCEAVWDGKRCNAVLAAGNIEYHHEVEAESGGDNSFENCRAVCIPCHKLLTKPFVQAIRKADRQKAAHLNAEPPPTRKVGQRAKPDQPSREAKPALPPRALFK